ARAEPHARVPQVRRTRPRALPATTVLPSAARFRGGAVPDPARALRAHVLPAPGRIARSLRERRKAMKTIILFRVWPYVAVTVLVLGLAVRWVALRVRRLPLLPSWPPPPMVQARGGSAARSRAWGPLAWCLLAAAHAVGILFPAAVLAW